MKTADKVIYTDGHEVTVTDTVLEVRKHRYNLNGVTKCALMVLHPNRVPGIIILVLGILAIIAGALQVIPSSIIPDVSITNKMVSANIIALWIGAGLSLIGILVLGIMRDRYAVRIATAEGEKDAVVSVKQEYVGQIVDAINSAITFVRTRDASRYFNVRGAEK